MEIKEIENKIINDDCMNILKQLPDKCIDLVLTDPPYGISFRSNHRKEKYEHIEQDNDLDWLEDWCREINRIKKDNAHIYIFCSWHKVDLFKSCVEKFFPVKNILVWEKNNTGMGDLINDYAPQYEFILFCNPNNKKINGNRDSNVLKFARTQNSLHPTEKPVSLFSYLVNKSSNENDLVLDCFSGSGTTAISCSELNRRFICIEKDKQHYETSVRRLENYNKQLKLF